VYWLEEHYAAGDRAPTPAYEVWTTADASDAAFVSRDKKVVLLPCGGLGPKVSAGCQIIGQPLIVNHGEMIGSESGHLPVPYGRLSSLPRDPVALDRYLAGLPLHGWGPAPVREFEIIKELLITYVMPPALTAELYQALGNIPGVTVDRHATDIAGRHGIGFRIALPASQSAGFDELILDPTTFAVMGQELIRGPAAGARAGHVMLGTAVLKTALVSGPGKTP